MPDRFAPVRASVAVAILASIKSGYILLVKPLGFQQCIEGAGRRIKLQPIRTALFDREKRTSLVRNDLPEMIRRELTHAGSLPEGGSFSARLLAWVELS